MIDHSYWIVLLPLLSAFAIFFFCGVMYFYFSSTYLKYKLLQDTSEFLLWQAYGLREINKHWLQIMKKAKGGKEKELRFAFVEADDFFIKVLKERGYDVANFEETITGINKKILPNAEDILAAHRVRDAIIHDPNYTLDREQANKMLADYERAIKNVSLL